MSATKRVMIVDDHAAVRRLVRSLFQAQVFDVCDAENGAEAVEKAQKLQPQSIVLEFRCVVWSWFRGPVCFLEWSFLFPVSEVLPCFLVLLCPLYFPGRLYHQNGQVGRFSLPGVLLLLCLPSRVVLPCPSFGCAAFSSWRAGFSSSCAYIGAAIANIRTQTQRTGGRIPDDRFRANFGREHVFVINRPVIVEGAPRFQYGGYWFIIANPWPVGWAYTGQVYVDYISGGYYLLSPVHPGVQVSINVVL
jgi:hypothetical protein